MPDTSHIKDFIPPGIPTQFGPKRKAMTMFSLANTDQASRNNQSSIYAVSSQYDIQAKAIQIYMAMNDNYKGKKAFAAAMMAQCINIHSRSIESSYNKEFHYANESFGTGDIRKELTLKDSILNSIQDYNPEKLINGESPILSIADYENYISASGVDAVVSFQAADNYEVSEGHDLCLPVSPMYFTWKALYDDAAEKEKSNRAEEITRKLSGITVLRNNYEAMVNYCRLMKLNIYEDKINSTYETTGLITNVIYHETYTTLYYTNLKTFAESIAINIKGDFTSKTNYIISFNSAVLHPGWIQRDKETDPDWDTSPEQYEIKENDIETEKEMWDALGADIGYDTKLSDDDEPDTKRNYDYEKERIDTEIESYKFRNMSSLNNLFLGMAKYAEQQENLAETTDAKNMWKRIKADANIMYKKIQQADEQPKQ